MRGLHGDGKFLAIDFLSGICTFLFLRQLYINKVKGSTSHFTCREVLREVTNWAFHTNQLSL